MMPAEGAEPGTACCYLQMRQRSCEQQEPGIACCCLDKVQHKLERHGHQDHLLLPADSAARL